MLQQLAAAATASVENDEKKLQLEALPLNKSRKHKHASTTHTRLQKEAVLVPVEPVVVPSSSSQPAVSLLSRSPVSSSPTSSSSSVRVLDNRVFHEVLNDALHNRNKKHIGKFMTDERFDRIVRACGLQKNDPSVNKSERETIAYNKYVAGADGRLFAWKAGHEKPDIATATWPTDMYEVVRFSQIYDVIAREHARLAGAKTKALYLSLQRQYKGIT